MSSKKLVKASHIHHEFQGGTTNASNAYRVVVVKLGSRRAGVVPPMPGVGHHCGFYGFVNVEFGMG